MIPGVIYTKNKRAQTGAGGREGGLIPRPVKHQTNPAFQQRQSLGTKRERAGVSKRDERENHRVSIIYICVSREKK